MDDPEAPRAVYTDEVVALYAPFHDQRPAGLAWGNENRQLLNESTVFDMGVGPGGRSSA